MANLCQVCKTNPGSVSAILSGTYYKHVCPSCNGKNIQVSSGAARWARSIDAEDREADIQQPYNSDGSINTRFAKLYPKQAKALFTSQQLDAANRK